MNSICAVSYLNGMIPECTYSIGVWANTCGGEGTPTCGVALQAGQADLVWANTREKLGHLLGAHRFSHFHKDLLSGSLEYLDASASRLEEVSSIAVTETNSWTKTISVTSKPRINWVGHSTCNQVRTRSPGFEPEVIWSNVF